MVWKFCEIWKSYGKWGPEGPKFCEILSHSVRYGMYANGQAPYITKTRLFKYTENFTTKTNENFQIKNSDIFRVSAQNIDYGYSLELPCWGGSNKCL